MFFEKSARFSLHLRFGFGHQESGFQVDLDLLVPGIQVLAHHNSEDPDEPHLRTAVSGGFKLIINLLSLVGMLDCRSPFIDLVPLVAVAGDGRKQARVVLGIGVDPPTIGRVRTR